MEAFEKLRKNQPTAEKPGSHGSTSCFGHISLEQLGLLENRNQVVFLLIKLAVNRTQNILNLAPCHVARDAPTERQLIAFTAADVPLLQTAVQAPDGRVAVVFAGIWHNHQKFISTLTEDNVSPAKAGGQ